MSRKKGQMTLQRYPRGYLTPNQIGEYRRTGFLTLRGICSLKEIRSWQEECRRLWDSVETNEDNPRLQWRDRADGTRVADRIDPLLDISPVFDALARDQRFVRAAADVLDADPEVFKAKLISKWPGTAGYKMHQDYRYWSFVGDVPFEDFVTVLIPIDPFDAESGATEMFPGYHDRFLDGLPDERRDVDESKMRLRDGVVLTLSPGDIALFSATIPHRSGTNRSKNNRESLFITYVRSGHGDLYARYYEKGPDF
jgi:ectoine hydroxylase-related dioxygenase (phytanoyl-CoA dioxygenase family)